MPTRSTHTQMDDQRKDHIDPERPTQGNDPKQQQNHNLPTDDVENINSTKKRKRFTTRYQAADCFLRNRKDATKDPEAQESYFT